MTSGNKILESWTENKETTLAQNFPMHRACRDGNCTELRDLLTQLQSNVTNAEILLSEDDYYHWTAGHFAAYFGKLDCLRLLMQAGAVYNSSRASMGLLPLPCPLTAVSSRCKQTLLQVAAFANHPHAVRWLLQSGAHLNLQDVNGDTALHKACRSGSAECVQLLLTHNVDHSLRNGHGLTAMELARACGHNQLADWLADRLHTDSSSAASGLTNGFSSNISTSSLLTNGDSHSTTTTTSASISSSGGSSTVNHLVSSNGYHGYLGNHSLQNGAAAAADSTSCSMDIEHEEAGASVNGRWQETLDLLISAEVSQNLVPVAGKKRGREDDECPQSKKGRFQDASWQYGWAPSVSPLTGAGVPPADATVTPAQQKSAPLHQQQQSSTAAAVVEQQHEYLNGAQKLQLGDGVDNANPNAALHPAGAADTDVSPSSSALASWHSNAASGIPRHMQQQQQHHSHLQQQQQQQQHHSHLQLPHKPLYRSVASRRSRSASSCDSQDSGIASLAGLDEGMDATAAAAGGGLNDSLNSSMGLTACTIDEDSSDVDPAGDISIDTSNSNNNLTRPTDVAAPSESGGSSSNHHHQQYHDQQHQQQNVAGSSGFSGCPIPAPAHLLSCDAASEVGLGGEAHCRRFMGGHFF